jgi:hypothetical protein
MWKRLDPLDAPSRSSRSVVLLWGMGGIGKTQIALEYAYTNDRHYSFVFWVKCETKLALERSCRLILQKLDMPMASSSTAEEVLIHFSKFLATGGLCPKLAAHLLTYAGRRYLLILDNVENLDTNDDPAQDIWIFLPPNGSIIVTSRRHPVLQNSHFNLETLPFDAESGSDFLLSLIIDDSSTREQKMPCNWPE